MLTAGICKAQNIITDTIYKKGIYRTFQEFKTNSPSIELKYPVKSHESPMPFNDWTNYSVDMPKEESKDIGDVYGFCNGHNIYLSNAPTNPHKGVFEHVLYVGKYTFYQDQGKLNVHPVVMPGGGMGLSTGSMPIYDKIIDMETGVVSVLNNRLIKKMMADNPPLLSEFKKDSKKNFRRLKYLKRYLEQKAVRPAN